VSELLYLAVRTLYSAFGRRKDLIVENLLLRQQLQVALRPKRRVAVGGNSPSNQADVLRDAVGIVAGGVTFTLGGLQGFGVCRTYLSKSEVGVAFSTHHPRSFSEIHLLKSHSREFHDAAHGACHGRCLPDGDSSAVRAIKLALKLDMLAHQACMEHPVP